MNWETLTHNLTRVSWAGASQYDLAAEVETSLAQPVGLPPLDQMMVAGDHVAVAICEGSPAVAAMLDATVTWLTAHGVAPEHLSLVLPLWELNPRSRKIFEQLREQHAGVQWIEHDPKDPYACAYLAANQQAQPIYFNRALIDADVVIGLRTARTRVPSDPAISLAFELYPGFTNEETWQRLYATHAQQRLTGVPWREELSEAENWLGTTLWLEGFTTPEGDLARIQSGDPQQLSAAARHLRHSLWDLSQLEPAELIVIDVPENLTWDWPTWLWAVGQARHAFEQAPKVLLRGQLPPLPPISSDSDLPQSAREILNAWTQLECERLGSDDDLWVLGKAVPELSDLSGWYWLDTEAEAQKLIERFESSLLVDAAFVMSGGLTE